MDSRLAEIMVSRALALVEKASRSEPVDRDALDKAMTALRRAQDALDTWEVREDDVEDAEPA